MRSRPRKLPAALAAAVLAVGVAGCGEAEQAADEAKDNVPADAVDQAEDAAQQAEDAAGEAAGQAGDAAREAEKALEEQLGQ